MASMSHHGNVWNTQEPFSKNIAELHAVELLRTRTRQEPLDTGPHSFLSTPGRYYRSQFVGHEEKVPTGGSELPIKLSTFLCAQRAPSIAIGFAFCAERLQKRRLLDEHSASLNLVWHESFSYFWAEMFSREFSGSNPTRLSSRSTILLCAIFSASLGARRAFASSWPGWRQLACRRYDEAERPLLV